jgi:predicted  nucleic acid-binding Zn-ribbon protein
LSKNLELLEQLQEADLRVHQLKNFIEHYADFVKELDEEIALLKKKAEMEKALLDELKKSKTRKELDLKQGEEHIAKCSGRLYTVKTNKEYEATLKEIEEQKQKNSDLETEILLLYDQIEQEEQRVKEVREKLEQEEKEIEERKKALAQKLTRAKALLPEQEKNREQIVSSIPKDLLENYQWIQQRMGTKVFTRVVDKVCQSCFRVIPAQMYNEVLGGDKILTCPGCNRILIYRETEFLLEEDPEF